MTAVGSHQHNRYLLLLAAQDALRYARRKLPLKSENKVRWVESYAVGSSGETVVSKPTVSRMLDAYEALSWLHLSTQGRDFRHSLCSFKPLTVLDFLRYAQAARQVRAGNCVEYTIVALEFLYRRGLRDIELIALEPPGDHAFLVLGSARQRGTVSKALPSNTVVCDPWANIVCFTEHYQTEWLKRMFKWELTDKEVCDGGSFQRPTQLSINYKKLVLFSAHENKDVLSFPTVLSHPITEVELLPKEVLY